MSARMEKVREALERFYVVTARGANIAAALAEVEEWEKSRRAAEIADRALTDYFADASRRAEAAEAELVRLSEAQQHFVEARLQAEAERDRLAADLILVENENDGLRAERDRLKGLVESALRALVENDDIAHDYPREVAEARAALGEQT